MKSFKQYISESGKPAGKLEVHDTSVDVAYKFAQSKYKNLDKDLPNLKKNYQLAKKAIQQGHTKRKDMPVITSRQIHQFKDALGKDAKFIKVRISDLKPIQEQVYFDRTIINMSTHSIANSLKYILEKPFVIDKDNHIIDGHHRFLAGMIIDPSIRVTILKVDMPLKKLLDYALHFSDNVLGNTRNK